MAAVAAKREEKANRGMIYRIPLGHDDPLIKALNHTCNGRRKVYNALLEEQKARQSAMRVFGLNAPWPSQYYLQNLYKEIKDTRPEYEWWKDLSSDMIRTAAADLAFAYAGLGRGGGHPKFKAYKRDRHSVRIPQDVKLKYKRDRVVGIKVPKLSLIHI